LGQTDSWQGVRGIGFSGKKKRNGERRGEQQFTSEHQGGLEGGKEGNKSKVVSS